ncbi:methionyl aminopeptidase [Maridesulfovibrio ferrireducens]|uniref:Methionine aminopeptidase n=1 Tax=Maridesulfovibrio ferrireducens TaxID=246191 RepID=A0A1G9IA84_9BACT|nr:type I methionyl aminopeptidase [Maridesulfovibrio ferrireducens]SDL22160.1 methionyl aminopeptidase [Maridesulfovibrio ferrireducens]
MRTKISIKSKNDIAKMRKAGLLLQKTHMVARSMVKPGVTTSEINEAVESFISQNGAIALFKGVQGVTPYPAGTCISVNEEVVHGIPGSRVLLEGDLVSIDIGVKLDGWCSDCACSYGVGTVSKEVQDLLNITEGCLNIALTKMKPGIKWRDIAKVMADSARKAGYSVVEELIGHGIGRELWESPDVPNYSTRAIPDFTLEEGMVIAVEPMINMGTHKIFTKSDNWTICTKDRKPSAHFEHSIAITADGVEVLTCDPNGEGWAIW